MDQFERHMKRFIFGANNIVSESMPDDLLVAIASGRPVALHDIKKVNADINAFGTAVTRTVLMAAAYAGNSRLILELDEIGAAINLANSDGFTALHEAAGQGNAHAVEVLLGLGANIDAESTHGFTPLMIASAWGCCDVIKLLIASGADIHHHDHAGMTALDLADEKGEDAACAILAEATRETLN